MFLVYISFTHLLLNLFLSILAFLMLNEVSSTIIALNFRLLVYMKAIDF